VLGNPGDGIFGYQMGEQNKTNSSIASQVNSRRSSWLRIGDQMDERLAWNGRWCEVPTSTLFCRMWARRWPDSRRSRNYYSYRDVPLHISWGFVSDL